MATDLPGWAAWITDVFGAEAPRLQSGRRASAEALGFIENSAKQGKPVKIK